MIRHVLLIKLKPETSAEERAECVKRMKAPPTQISFAKQYEAGLDMLHGDTSWDLMQLIVFGNKDQIFEFRNHPAHLEALKYVSPRVAQMAGVDCDYESR